MEQSGLGPRGLRKIYETQDIQDNISDMGDIVGMVYSKGPVFER